MIIQILNSKEYSQKALNIYRSLGTVSSVSEKADILVIRLEKIDKDFLNEYPNLKIIASPTTGLNHIDLIECERKGIKVISLKGESKWLNKNITSTAEHTWALLLSLIRNIPGSFMDIKKGNWNRENWIGHQLKDKTILLIGGNGRVATQVKNIAKAFQMNVLISDKNDNLNKVIHLADIISIHVDLNKETYNLINNKVFNLMKPTSYLINTSRGEVIDEQDLLVALKRNKIAGAALDVLWDEVGNNHLKNNQLIEYAKIYNNLIITPHIAGASKEAMEMTENYIAEKVKNHIKHNAI